MKEYRSIREPAVAGQFYDYEPKRLKNQILTFLKDAKEKKKTDLKTRAIIVPHAGYIYSGKTAAKAFSLLEEKSYERALIIAPSHRYRFYGLAYSNFDSFATPLGEIETDKDSLAKIAKKSNYIQSLERAHANEHSLEVELPFLQVVQPKIRIIPLICGMIDDHITDEIANILSTFWNEETIWIISSDFTHYGLSFGYLPFSTGNIIEKIKKLDLGAVEKILDINYTAFSNYIEETEATICGEKPIKILLKTLEKSVDRQKIKTELIDYTNSADISGDISHCVSYVSIAFFSK